MVIGELLASVRRLQSFPKSGRGAVFHIASVTKLLTAIAAVQLVESGALTLHRDVRQSLGAVNAAGWSRHSVTLHQLLTHTAGLDTRWIGMASADPSRVRALEEYLQRETPPIIDEPGRGVVIRIMACRRWPPSHRTAGHIDKRTGVTARQATAARSANAHRRTVPGYAYGSFTYPNPYVRAASMGREVPGFSTRLLMVPELRLGVVLMVNRKDPSLAVGLFDSLLVRVAGNRAAGAACARNDSCRRVHGDDIE